MAQVSSDSVILFRSTLRMYRTSFENALRGLRLNWWLPLGHILLFGAFIFFSNIFVGIFGGLVASFVLGLVGCLVLSLYLASVESAVDRETVSREALWHRGVQLFSPVLSALFILFILSFLANMAFRSPETKWLHATLNLVIAVFFNPLPEILYQREGHGTQSLGECLEFVKENFIEWFVPVILIGLPLILIDITGFAGYIITNPISIEGVFSIFSMAIGALGNFFSFTGGYLVLLCLTSFAVYFFFLFRGNLFKQLHGSSRRKRIYDYKFR